MTKIYVCQHNYQSSYGELLKDAEYELTVEQAAAFNADSPGVLVEKVEKVEKKPATKKPATKSRQTKAQHNR